MDVKTAVVLGYGVTGKSAAQFLNKSLGVEVYVFDQRLDVQDNEFQFISDLNELEKIYQEVDLVVTSPGILLSSPLLQEAKRLGIPVIGEVELGYHFCTKPIVSITGTNGKSTTTTLLGKVLKNSFVTGNIGIPFAANINEINQSDFDVVVLETSAGQLESTKCFKPHIAIMTNITAEHMNLYGWEEYVSHKKRVFQNQEREDFLILNYQDELVRSFADESNAKVLYFSTSFLPKGEGDAIFVNNDKIVIRIDDNEEVVMDIKEVKVGILENVLAVIGASICLGEDLSRVRKIISEFPGLEHALEFVMELNHVQFFNDSKATNPGSTIHALKSLERNVILITGGQADKLNDFSDLVKAFPKYTKYVFTIGETKDEIMKLSRKYNFRNICKSGSLEHALLAAYELAKPGDYVLFSPGANSRDMFPNHRERGRIFKKLVLRRLCDE